MRAEGLPAAAVDTFAHYHALLEAGESGMLLEDELEPVAELPDFEDLPEGDPPLDEAVVIKLNGGLGTSMGMDRAKSLLEVKAGQSFLDIVARLAQSIDANLEGNYTKTLWEPGGKP